MICTKCKIDQPEDNYSVYWHSRFNKHYRRRICRDCTNSYNKEYKQKVLKQKLKDRTHKLCKVCNQILPVDEFYKVGINRTPAYRCKKCNNTRNVKDVWNNLDYRSNPNEWVNDEQRKIVHNILRLIGWSFNKEKGIWYKLPLKDRDGKWNIKIDKPIIKRDLIIKLNKEELIEYRQKGWSYKRIANIYKVSTTTIRNRLKFYEENVEG